MKIRFLRQVRPHSRVARVRWAGIAFVLTDILAISAAAGSVQALHGLGSLQSELSRVTQFFALGILLCVWLGFRGHYTQRLPLFTEFQHVVTAAGMLGLIDAYLHVVATGSLSQLWNGAVWIVAAIFVLAGRVGVKRALFALGPWRCPTIVAGSRSGIDSLSRLPRSDPYLGGLDPRCHGRSSRSSKPLGIGSHVALPCPTTMRTRPAQDATLAAGERPARISPDGWSIPTPVCR